MCLVPSSGCRSKTTNLVKAGDLLFEIDPRTFQASLDQALAQLYQTGGNVAALEKQVEAAKASVRASQAASEQAKSAIAQMVATIEKNKAEYERQQTLLPKKATSVKAPVSYTHLTLPTIYSV